MSLPLLALAGALVLGMSAGWAALAGQFVYGAGHAERPLHLVVSLWLAGWLGYAVAVWSVSSRSDSRRSLLVILAVGLAARTVLVPSRLLQENDPYRYVTDGMAVIHGLNPYSVTPEELRRAAHGGPAAGTLPSGLLASLDSDGARHTLRWVSYPELRTLYPPAAQAAFGLGAALTPWDWRGQRAVAMAADILALAAVLWLLRSRRLPLAYSVAYWWNPLVLKEAVNSAHVDVLAAALLTAALAALARRRSPGWLAWTGSGTLVALAGLVKLYPFALIPLTATACWRTGGRRAALLHAASASVVTVLAYLPLAGAGTSRLTETLGVYLAGWARNGGAREWLAGLLGMLPVVGAHGSTAAAVVVGIALASAMAAGVSWIAASRSAAECPRRLTDATALWLGLWLLTAAAVFPWYALPLLAVASARPRLWTVGWSGLLAAYYLLFMAEYRLPDAAAAKRLIQGLEHAGLWGLALLALWNGPGAGTPPFRRP